MGKKKLSDLADVVSQFEIRELRMVECHCREPRLEPTGLPTYLNLPTKVDTAINRKERLLRVEILFSLFASYSEIDDDSGMENAAIAMTAKFRLILHFDERNSQSDKEISTFGQRSGVIFAWPLWREFALSMSGRLALPPLIIPMLNIPGVLGGADDAADPRYSRKFGHAKEEINAPQPCRSLQEIRLREPATPRPIPATPLSTVHPAIRRFCSARSRRSPSEKELRVPPPGSFGTRGRKPACPIPRFAAFPNDPGGWRPWTARVRGKPTDSPCGMNRVAGFGSPDDQMGEEFHHLGSYDRPRGGRPLILRAAARRSTDAELSHARVRIRAMTRPNRTERCAEAETFPFGQSPMRFNPLNKLGHDFPKASPEKCA